MAGMKEGTGSDPFADPPEDEGDTDDGIDERVVSEDPETTEAQIDTEEASTSESGRLEPYIYTREKVKEGREDYPVPLRPDTREAIEDLKREIEARFDEEVYKADLLEAAIEHAIGNPDDVAEMLETERYGYNWW